jgi:prevent-host-death family protein
MAFAARFPDGAHNMTMATGHLESGMDISAAEFKAKCLKLLDEVAATGRPLVVTKRGRPVARVVPIDPETAEPLFGFIKGAVAFHGDVVSPIDESWAAESGDEAAFDALSGAARR